MALISETASAAQGAKVIRRTRSKAKLLTRGFNMEAIQRASCVRDVVHPLRQMPISVTAMSIDIDKMRAYFLGLCNHHMAIHEYVWDAFIDARQNWCTCMHVRTTRKQTSAMVHQPIVIFGTKWLNWNRLTSDKSIESHFLPVHDVCIRWGGDEDCLIEASHITRRTHV